MSVVDRDVVVADEAYNAWSPLAGTASAAKVLIHAQIANAHAEVNRLGRYVRWSSGSVLVNGDLDTTAAGPIEARR